MKALYRLQQNPEALNSWRVGILLFLPAFAIWVTAIVVLHPHQDSARYELERAAISRQ